MAGLPSTGRLGTPRKKQKKLKKEKRVALIEKVEIDEKPEMPSGNLEAGAYGQLSPTSKPKKKRVR